MKKARLSNLKMDKMKLPIIKGNLPKARAFSMDDYFRFVIFNLKYVVDIKAVRREKKKLAVNVPFRF